MIVSTFVVVVVVADLGNACWIVSTFVVVVVVADLGNACWIVSTFVVVAVVVQLFWNLVCLVAWRNFLHIFTVAFLLMLAPVER